jgi:hypothetical protein
LGIVKRIEIVVVAAPQRSRGCAEVGGHRMVLAIAPPSYSDYASFMRRLSRLFEHEARHLQGIEHAQMSEALLYSLGPTCSWAKGLRIRYVRRAPRQIDVLG